MIVTRIAGLSLILLENGIDMSDLSEIQVSKQFRKNYTLDIDFLCAIPFIAEMGLLQ